MIADRTAAPVRIVIADDHPLYRDGVAMTLDESGEFTVVSQGASADEAVALVDRSNPDMVLLDISMPGGGIEAARRISAGAPGTRIVMLTVSEAEEDVMEALKAGASGYVLKGVGGDELISTLRDIVAGQSYVSPALAARLLSAMRKPKAPKPEDALEQLTDREVKILQLVSQGLSNKEVGRALDLQEKTIKHYMTSILQKLHVRNRVEAAVLARGKWGDGA